jgi:hypothetical protein
MTMKKLIALLLAVLMLAALSACDSQTATPTQPTETSGQEQTDPTQSTEKETEPASSVQEVFSFTYEGVELIPGEPFDPSVLPEAESVYEIPSCAIEGTDNVYTYPTFELIAYNDGSGEVIYSVYLLDANTPTPEGLYLGDEFARVTELYGTEYTADDTETTFTKGNTTLNLIVDGDTVVSIEYRMVV